MPRQKLPLARTHTPPRFPQQVLRLHLRAYLRTHRPTSGKHLPRFSRAPTAQTATWSLNSPPGPTPRQFYTLRAPRFYPGGKPRPTKAAATPPPPAGWGNPRRLTALSNRYRKGGTWRPPQLPPPRDPQPLHRRPGLSPPPAFGCQAANARPAAWRPSPPSPAAREPESCRRRRPCCRPAALW